MKIMEYDENKAIDYIRKHTDGICDKYDDDQIVNVMDMIFDYYDEHGMLDIDFNEDGDSDDDNDNEVADMVAYVKKMLAKDKGAEIADADIEPIIRAELGYEEYLVENM